VNIALVAMSGVRVKNAELVRLGVTLPGFVRRGKVIASLPSLGLLTVAGLTPRRHELRYFEVDERIDAMRARALRSGRDLFVHGEDQRCVSTRR